MNRKLLALDVVLAAAILWGGWEWRSQWLAAKARQSAMPGPALKPAPVAHPAPLAQPPAVLPGNYLNVAQQFLFDPSRNPNLPPPPPPKPEPEPVPPPLPAYHGSMDLGDPQGPVALITDKDSQGYLQVHAQETIGEFTLLSFNRQEMVLDWRGKQIHKRLGEESSEPERAKAGGAGPINNMGVIPGIAAPQQPQQQQPQQQLGPGTPLTDTMRGCQANDSSPAGTQTDGYVKELRLNPFGGSTCLWRAVGK